MLDGTRPTVWTALRTSGDPQTARITASAPVVEMYDCGERITVLVCGEVDIDVAPAFHTALRTALDRSSTGLDLELHPLRFCDAAGLRALLQVRKAASEARKTMYIRSASPLITRLLHITHTDHLFTDPGPTQPPPEGAQATATTAPTRNRTAPPAQRHHEASPPARH